jgi:S-methylmethionine-dependent homocysteine/selenocysteine methylase
MTRYRRSLPQLAGTPFLTDGGIETTLMFREGLELPHFAAFHLLSREEGRRALLDYYRTYAAMAKRHCVGFILESPTWRASPDWAERLGYSQHALDDLNRRAIALMCEVRDEFDDGSMPIVISGCLGSRGDGYVASDKMSDADAERYHAAQIEVFADTEADLVTAMTMNYTEEAIGVARAARAAGLPVVISFTVETDGKLPTGEALGQAIERVDHETKNAPVYYMINCAHPTHLAGAFTAGAAWIDRIRALRANASSKSHAELNDATELDDGNPLELGNQCNALRARLGSLNVLGGCCGTDHRHVDAMFTAWRSAG